MGFVPGPPAQGQPWAKLCEPLGERRKGLRRPWVTGKVEVGRSSGLFGLDHVSVGSEEGKVCSSQALSVLGPSASAWITS